MIEFNPREVFEKETKHPYTFYGVDSYRKEYVEWLEQRNKELVEALVGYCKWLSTGELHHIRAGSLDHEDMIKLIIRNTGKKIEELIK